MKNKILRTKKTAVRIALPWLAEIITFFPYTKWSSRFLDKVIVLSEDSYE